ncbi:spermine synthase, partial [bacterium]|nr:spermine synthase [bacterium]
MAGAGSVNIKYPEYGGKQPVPKRLVIAILIMGFSGIVSQILLLKELLISFYGNELSIGIILANWVILEAIGSFVIGKKIEKIKRKIEAFVGLTLLFSFCFPIAIYLVRVWKEIIGLSSGEGFGLFQMLYSSFFILLPVSLSHGALFTFSCKIFSLYSSNKGETQRNIGRDKTAGAKQDAESIGNVYIYETIGTIVGGVAFTYLLFTHFSSIQIALGTALLNIIVCIFLLSPAWGIKKASLIIREKIARKTLGPESFGNGAVIAEKSFVYKILSIVSLILFILCAYFLFSSKAEEIHWLSVQKQWQSQNIIHYQNSIYGNVAVTKNAEQYTFFSDGVPIITTPTPDIVFMEEFIHLSMLFHSNPKEILIIGGAAGGLLNEILKHPVERLDYVELDPLILETVSKFSTPLTETEFADPRVKNHYMDGRLFVKKTLHKYDMVLIGLPNPQDLQVNRLFTREFFSLVKNRLNKDGILAINLPGSLTYLSEELKDLNACILNTLKDVYPAVRIIPGDGTNIFLSSLYQELNLIDHVQLSQRFRERMLQVRLLTPAHIEYKLHPGRLSWFLKSLQDGTDNINQDFKPMGVYYGLSYWNALFSPYAQRLFKWFEGINLWFFIIPLFIFTTAFLFLRYKIERLKRINIPYCIATTGFTGMILDIALIYTFQILYGYVFHWIGLLVTAFMVGTAVGSIAITLYMDRIKKDIVCFIKIEIAIIMLSGTLPLILLKLSYYLDRPAIFIILQLVF